MGLEGTHPCLPGAAVGTMRGFLRITLVYSSSHRSSSPSCLLAPAAVCRQSCGFPWTGISTSAQACSSCTTHMGPLSPWPWETRVFGTRIAWGGLSESQKSQRDARGPGRQLNPQIVPSPQVVAVLQTSVPSLNRSLSLSPSPFLPHHLETAQRRTPHVSSSVLRG